MSSLVRPSSSIKVPGDVIALALLTLLLNGHLLTSALLPQHFHPAAIARGEWWRVLTHPFVHVSVAHLVMDALGFFSLYVILEARSALRRLLDVGCCAAGSLLVSLCLSDRIGDIGLCGLSGVAHGLMAVVGLEMVTRAAGDRARRTCGALVLALVALKVSLEAWHGDTLFAGLALGRSGEAIAVCHLGGVLGGLLGRALPRLVRASRAGGDRPGRTSSSPGSPAAREARGCSVG